MTLFSVWKCLTEHSLMLLGKPREELLCKYYHVKKYDTWIATVVLKSQDSNLPSISAPLFYLGKNPSLNDHRFPQGLCFKHATE